MSTNKKEFAESDIRARYITPAIEQAGWDPMTQIFHEFGLLAGRISMRGRAAHRDQTTILKADYALFFKPNIPIARIGGGAEQFQSVSRVNELHTLCADLRQRLNQKGPCA